MKLLIIAVIVLAIIALAQIMKVYQLSSKLRGKDEAELTKDETNFNSVMLIIFMVVFMVSSIYLFFTYGARPGLGASASEHGVEIDSLYDMNWVILLIVFFITQPILFIFAAKYKYKEGNKATWFSHSSKLELVWTIIPALVLAVIIIMGLNVWNNITEKKENVQTIEIYAKQFNWFVRYAGDDNKLGKTDFKVIDEVKNPLGVLTSDVINERITTWSNEVKSIEETIKKNQALTDDDKISEMKSKVSRLNRQIKRLGPLLKAQTSSDDSTALNDIIVKELVLLKGKEYEFKFRSRDVIHSAYFPHFRAQMNCVPGMVSRFAFKPILSTKDKREDPVIVEKYKALNKKKIANGEEEVEFDYLLLCNKICGASHYNMQMKITVVDTKAEYDREYDRITKGKSFVEVLGLVEVTEEKVEEVTEEILVSDSVQVIAQH